MNKLIINADLGRQTISRHIYGHFAEHLGRCIYEGIWVGTDSEIPNTRGMRNDVIDALRKLQMPNLRWPGGCFADTYHWKDGIGPREKRPSMVNVHWGGTTENNHFGTHEFFDLVSMLGTEPYIAGNVGSGTVQEMAEWLEYITMPGQSPMADLRRKNGREEPWDVKYWGVGNENWGCGGTMTAQQYAWEFRKYQGYCRHYGAGGGASGGADKKLYKVACGFTDEWNEILLREAAQFIDGLSIHHYTIPGKWPPVRSATRFDMREWQETMRAAADVDDFLKRTTTLLDRYDKAGKIGIILDEWGTWFAVEPGTNPGFLYQQNTLRDALVAGLSLNIFNSHAGRLHMANIAQTVNVLQAMILTEGAKMLLTPTYHVFEMFKGHQDATLLPSDLSGPRYGEGATEVPQLSASVSRRADGSMLMTLCNLHHEDGAELECEFRGAAVTSVAGEIVTANEMNSMNTFEKPTQVQKAAFADVHAAKKGIVVKLPAKSVVALRLKAS